VKGNLEGFPLILVGNKCDEESGARQVSTKTGEALQVIPVRFNFTLQIEGPFNFSKRAIKGAQLVLQYYIYVPRYSYEILHSVDTGCSFSLFVLMFSTSKRNGYYCISCIKFFLFACDLLFFSCCSHAFFVNTLVIVVLKERLDGAATKRWILQWLHHKTDFALTSFPFIRIPILCRL
jgi:hypothetical protein